MPNIALAIIAKDEVDLVCNIVEKYGKYFNEIAVAVDEKNDEFKTRLNGKADIYDYEWINNFAHKRNFLADKIKSPYYLRMDTDDDLENPEFLKEVVDMMEEKGFYVFYAPYIYSKDSDGNCDAKHWRESVIRKHPEIIWNKEIHENIFIKNPDKFKILRDPRLKIIHNITPEHARDSFRRNLKYLIDEYSKDGDSTDPRTMAYIGRAMMADAQWKTAIFFLEKLILRSGWDDDKYFAYVQMAQCWQELGDFERAIACCNEALAMNTKFPDAYLQMGIVYISKGDFDKAVDWIMPGIVRPEPDTVMVLDPTFYGYRAKMNAAMAFLGKGDVEKAWDFFCQANKLAPNNEFIKEKESLFRDAFENDKYIKNLLWIIGYTKDRDANKIPSLINSIPDSAMKDERFHALKMRFSAPKKWGDKDIVIFCGPAWEDWSPASVLKGIGGSEEAVIYLSRELVKLDWNVTVFNQCGDMAGEYEGVVYKSYYEMNPRDIFNYFVSWRHNIYRNTTIQAKKTMLWLHDVPQDLDDENGARFNKVIVLSKFHESLLPNNVDKSQIIVSSNGINLPDFKDTGLERNSKRIIYTSSYDRGIEHLLLMWPDILKEVPDAELHLFYGWNTYDEMMKKGARNKRFKEQMQILMNQPNVFEHGRVGHKQLVKEFQKSGIWCYPSHFEEISCISAMKAQAAGCVPVTVNYAALNETVKAGILIQGKCGEGTANQELKAELIRLLKDPQEQEKYRASVLSVAPMFGWDRVAKEWAENLLVSNQ